MLGLLMGITTLGCASAQDQGQSPRQCAAQPGEQSADPPPDPLIGFNHPMFVFNQKMDQYALKPLATGWTAITPKSVRQSVFNFFNNTEIVPRFANAIFQFDLKDAGTELTRFAVNATVGVGGLFDPADKWFGLKQQDDDFGLTLAKYGVPEGPYLVLPVFGPSTIRDAAGKAADIAMNPVNYLAPSDAVVYGAEAGAKAFELVNYRAEYAEYFADLDRYAIDGYGAMQDAYLSRRRLQEHGCEHAPIFMAQSQRK
jgi:phospholipid-binding lipoprotein MlaA